MGYCRVDALSKAVERKGGEVRGEVRGGGVVSLFDVFRPFPFLSRGARG